MYRFLLNRNVDWHDMCISLYFCPLGKFSSIYSIILYIYIVYTIFSSYNRCKSSHSIIAKNFRKIKSRNISKKKKNFPLYIENKFLKIFSTFSFLLFDVRFQKYIQQSCWSPLSKKYETNFWKTIFPITFQSARSW